MVRFTTPLKDLGIHLCGKPQSLRNTMKLPELQKRNGMIMDLFSKSIGTPRKRLIQQTAEISVPQVAALQQKLAEISDMMYTSHILHQRVLNIAKLSDEDRSEQKYDEIHTGNCLSILMGDQLLANASRCLAELRNPFIVEWMSLALEDFCKYNFFVEEQVDLSEPDCILKNIEQRCYFRGGSLLGHSCKSAALLAGYSQTDDKLFLNDAFNFGNNIGITFELQDFLDSNANKLINLEKLTKEETINYMKKSLEGHISKCLQLVNKLPKFESTVKIRSVIESIANKYLHQYLIEQRV